MSRYIDADELKVYEVPLKNEWHFTEITKVVFAEDILDAPSIDIVRCRECRYSSICNRGVQHTTRDMSSITIGYKHVDFCSYGEREGE